AVLGRHLADGDPAGGDDRAAVRALRTARADQHLQRRHPDLCRPDHALLGLPAHHLLPHPAARAVRIGAHGRRWRPFDPLADRPAAVAPRSPHARGGQCALCLERPDHRDHLPAGRCQAHSDGRHQRLSGPLRGPDPAGDGRDGDRQRADADPLHRLPAILHPRPDGGSGEMSDGNPVVLSGGALRVTVNPLVGGTITAIEHVVLEASVCGTVPWQADMAPNVPAVALDESTWLTRYSGGWPLLFPNGGDACRFAGTDHGFHGEASIALWEVEADAAMVRLARRFV